MNLAFIMRCFRLWGSLMVLAHAAFPTTAAESSIAVANVPGFPGASVTVPVSLRQPAGEVVALQYDIRFDARRVASGGAVGTTRLKNHVVKSREIAPGVRRTLVYSLQNAPVPGTNGPVVQSAFTVDPLESVGSGPLTPTAAVVARADGTAVPTVGLSSGTIFVRPVNLLSDGKVQFFLPSTLDQRYAIQSSTNFVDWLTFSTNVATGDFMSLLDAEAKGAPYRFYRWELLPK